MSRLNAIGKEKRCDGVAFAAEREKRRHPWRVQTVFAEVCVRGFTG
jgi:hypothetical protein